MEDENSEVACDSHEQDLQRTDEIQTLSEEVLALVQDDDGPPKRTELKAVPAQAPASSTQAALALSVQPPMRTESAPVPALASLIHASSDSYALKTQSAQELDVQPLMRAESAPAQLLNNLSRPGAYYSAPGATQLVAAQLSSSSKEAVIAENSSRFVQEDSEESRKFDSLEQSGPDTISVSEGTSVFAVKVEPDAEEQLFRRKIFEEALQVDVVESVAEAPLVENDNRKWRQLSVYLLVAFGVLTLLGLVVGLVVNVGLTKQNDVSGEDETPKTTPPKPFLPTLEAIRQRGVLRCGHPGVSYHIRFEPETGERVGFEVDLVSSLFVYLW
jgi:hypothetical protein